MYLSIRASTTETIARRGGSVVQFGVETSAGENRVPGAPTIPHYRSGMISWTMGEVMSCNLKSGLGNGT